NGSQFFIVQTEQTYEAYLDQFGLNDAQKELFKQYGGTPWLYQVHTVFGQVYEGMDVVDKIAAVETDSNDKPLTDVVIEHIEVSKYE
ncbi:MAG: peptidylprolyl isomerase, partial [Firmicutes bacterium]|nr:peptidylprolyl isomerase [Bacillota bacterium]